MCCLHVLCPWAVQLDFVPCIVFEQLKVSWTRIRASSGPSVSGVYHQHPASGAWPRTLNSWQGIYLPLGDYLHLSSSQMSNFRWNPFSKMAVWLPLWTLFAEKGVFRFVSMMPSDQKYLGCITVWEHHEAQFKIQFSYYLVAWSSKVDCSMCVH